MPTNINATPVAYHLGSIIASGNSAQTVNTDAPNTRAQQTNETIYPNLDIIANSFVHHGTPVGRHALRRHYYATARRVVVQLYGGTPAAVGFHIGVPVERAAVVGLLRHNAVVGHAERFNTAVAVIKRAPQAGSPLRKHMWEYTNTVPGL